MLKTFLFILKCHKMANAPIEGLAVPLAKKLENFMTKAKSKMSVKFFNDVAQRFPGYLIGQLEKLSDLSITAVNGYRKSVASDLMLKVVKSGETAQIHAKFTVHFLRLLARYQTELERRIARGNIDSGSRAI